MISAHLLKIIHDDSDDLRAGRQCQKWRTPVRYRLTPAAFAAAMTSSSRTDPPGSTTARTPASASTWNPSANGKYASLAATDPAARSPALVTASRAASTRLTWPMPIPTEARAEASRIALDLTLRHAGQANSRSASTASLAACPEDSRHPASLSPGSDA